MLRFIFTFACAALVSVGSCFAKKDNTIFADNFNNQKKFAKQWTNNLNDFKTATIEYLKDGGVDNSGCVKITNSERGAARVRHEIKGLVPGQLYRMSAMLKCEGVKEGRGAVIYLEPEGLEQSWNASAFAYEDKDWTEIYMDFVPDKNGNATICCALGFPWGTYNGGKALGTVWYDNVKVVPVTDQMYRRESNHIVVWFDPEKVTVNDAQMDEWLSKLDKVYDSYVDLVGAAPYDGRKIHIINTPGIEKGYWALAGNPILWNNNVKVTDVIERAVNLDDWGFGILHEIGHVFSARNIFGRGSWNWNDEIFANFRMSYAVEMCNGGVSQRNVIYRGDDVRTYYKIFYDETIGQNIAKNNGDALHYTFLRIKDKYGWDVYKKAFRALYALEENELPKMRGAYERFIYFLSHVSKAAGEDVTKTCYTPEELKLIEESLKSR